jgi:hypothetical protein
MMLWIAITIGRILGVVDQTFINTPILYNHLTIFLVGGVLSMALILALPSKFQGLRSGHRDGGHGTPFRCDELAASIIGVSGPGTSLGTSLSV